MFTSLHKQPKHFHNVNSSFDKSRTPFSSSTTSLNTNNTSNHNISLLSNNPISKTTTFHNYLHFNNNTSLHKTNQNDIDNSKNTTLSFLKKSFLLSPSPPKPSNPNSSCSISTITAYNSSGFPNNLKSKITAIINRKHPTSSTSLSSTNKVKLNEYTTSINNKQRFIKSKSTSDLNNTNTHNEHNTSATMMKLNGIHRLLCNNNNSNCSNSLSNSFSNINVLRNNIYDKNKGKKLIKEKNTHVDVFNNKYNIRNVNKSLPYQRLEHMKKVLDLQIGSNIKHNIKNSNNNNHKRKGSVNESENNINNNNNILASTRELRIKNKIRMLNNFKIFPNYNTRKINNDLRNKYINNNLNIISTIKDKITKNINESNQHEKSSSPPVITDELTVDDIM